MCGIRKLGTLPLCVGFAILAIVAACAYSAKACDPVVSQQVLRLSDSYDVGCHNSSAQILRLESPSYGYNAVERVIVQPVVRERLVIAHPQRVVQREVVVQRDRERLVDRLRARRAIGAQRRADRLSVNVGASRSRSVQRVVVRSH